MGGNQALKGGGNTENRQAFLTFGDKSWGSVKVGKDLGIFGSTAILNDMTLLGVGAYRFRYWWVTVLTVVLLLVQLLL